MKKYKGFLSWVAACLWGVGSIGGFLVSVTSGYAVIGVCVAGVAAMAFPFVRNLFKNDPGE